MEGQGISLHLKKNPNNNEQFFIHNGKRVEMHYVGLCNFQPFMKKICAGFLLQNLTNGRKSSSLVKSQELKVN